MNLTLAEAMRPTINRNLWHACAGGKIKMPDINSKVYYFPQGHAEHSSEVLHPDAFPRMASVIPCSVIRITFMADPDTDEIYVKMRLLPMRPGEELPTRISDSGATEEMPESFYKVLTQSDANTGGGLSVPKHCAENIFPALNYAGNPPVQTLTVKDIHSRTWSFRHIYRGTPKRHLLTTGWSNFVNQKRLIAGDKVVFVKAPGSELLIGIIRGKPGMSRIGNRISRESVTEAAILASRGQSFEIVYYPRADTREFCVSSSLVKEAMKIRWFPGMRFKMEGETDDSSRTSHFYGTVVACQEIDPYRWPRSPWRALQVTWDGTHRYKNLKSLSPWIVQQTQIPPCCYSPRKKQMTWHHSGIPMFATFRSSSSALSPADWVGLRSAAASFIEESGSIQRARKRQALQLRRSPDHPTRRILVEKQDSISPLSKEKGAKTYKVEEIKKPAKFRLFGQKIYTEEDLCSSPTANDENVETNGRSFRIEDAPV